MALLPFNLPALRKLAVPSVCFLIAFLAYSSQYLFYHLEPGPFTREEATWFNILVACIWWSYERACRVDPGRLPKHLREEDPQDGGKEAKKLGNWCKKCKAVKPPRAHHCRQCNRCIPKMDHHCPWTSNCVSHTTFPHFLRFVFYAVLSMGLLEYHLFNRGSIIYQQRNLPSYLGPSIFALAHLIILLSLNSLVLFALLILLISAIHSLSINTTMIESWEIERHERLAEKARYHGGFVYGPGGRKIRIKKQEFPYDIGIWANLVQGMGTPNVLAWFVPFGGGADNETGWEFEVNGFEDADVMWPPPDPDRMAQETWTRPREERRGGFVHGKVGSEMEAFRRRQEEDYARRGMLVGDSRGRGAPGSYDWLDMEEDEGGSGYSEGIDGEEGWTNSDGNRLRDFGVDEEAELLDGGEDEDEDDVPLGELLRRRRGRVEVAA